MSKQTQGGIELTGEVICWATSTRQPHGVVVQALKDVGLDASVCKDMLPRYAFSRACKKLQEQRIISRVDEGKTTITFQFTRIAFDSEAKEHIYNLECKLELNKETGVVSCPAAPDLAAHAYKLLCDEQTNRTPGDITRMVQKLFTAKADLFPIREQGGAYFVPAKHSAFTDKIAEFLGKLGGRITRFPVPKGTPHGDAAARDAIVNGIHGLIKDHLDAVKAFDMKTRDNTWSLRLEAIKETRFKVEAYKEYLVGQTEELQAAIDAAALHLSAEYDKMHAETGEEADAGKVVNSDEVLNLSAANGVHVKAAVLYEVACDHCGAENTVEENAPEHTCETCGKAFPLEW